jgi:hypothetical protein
MIQETWYWDQSHKQTVETGGAEKGLFSEWGRINCKSKRGMGKKLQ